MIAEICTYTKIVKELIKNTKIPLHNILMFEIHVTLAIPLYLAHY